jgi:hemoglobin
VASTPGESNPHYRQLGGQQTIERLVTRFYEHMDTLPEAAQIRALHPADLGPVRRVLIAYLTEWTGGPPLYSSERGHPRLRRRHLGFAIGVAERDAWMSCMRLALGDVVADSALRASLERVFFQLADFLRNQPEAAEPRATVDDRH